MRWIATYHDGTTVTDQDVGNSEEIDRSKLAKFALIKDGRIIFVCFFPNDGSKKLIFRKRSAVSVNGTLKRRVYLVGWHELVGGKSVKSICYIDEQTGIVEFDGDRNDLELVKVEQWQE